MRHAPATGPASDQPFPFLFGGAFIEAGFEITIEALADKFPFLFGGAFIEARSRFPEIARR